jgi:Disulfide bond isomerase protein N-terminus
MTASPPPEQPAAIALACAPVLSQADADLARERIAGTLSATKFTAAWPATLPGFVALRLEDGSVAYTDKYGRYLVLGLVFDVSNGKALDRQLDGLKE